MDAREQLRRYLEQRREAGETELVLDHLDAEEVMRLLGAGGGTGTSPSPGHQENEATDWRQVLRDAAREARGDTKKPPNVRPPADAPAPAPAPSPSPSPSRRMAFGGEAPSTGADSHATMPLDRIPTGYAVGSMTSELFGGPAHELDSLEAIDAAVANCTKCALYATAKHPVPGEGDPQAQLVCVGEAPGAREDELGRPFVGPAGQLLDKILAAIKLSRNEVYICNVLKHRPPGNRNPMPSEVEACSPYLVRQIELIRPKVIVAFGTFAAQTLLSTKDAISKLRGKIHRYYGVPLVVTYHPAALLRNPGWKRPTWEDVQLARRLLDRAVSS